MRSGVENGCGDDGCQVEADGGTHQKDDHTKDTLAYIRANVLNATHLCGCGGRERALTRCFRTKRGRAKKSSSSQNGVIVEGFVSPRMFWQVI